MITEHTHSENNDWQESVEEQLSASESSARPPTVDAREQKTEMEGLAQETPATSVAEGEVAAPVEEQPGPHREVYASSASDEQEKLPGTPEPLSAQAESAPAVKNTASGGAQADASHSPAAQETRVDETIRPFSDFIEEFRQTEERFNALLKGQDGSFTTLTVSGEMVQEPVVSLETSAENGARADDAAAVPTGVVEEREQTSEAVSESAAAPAEEVRPAPPAERPVSPLLRPATRIRLPRHSRHRVEEPAPPAPAVELVTEQPASVSEQQAEEMPATAEVPAEEQPARPARRYRFDRPAATASASLTTAKVSAPATRATETKEKRGANHTAHKESEATSEQAPARANASNAAPEAPAQKPSSQEAAPVSAETAVPAAPAAPTSERRRRSSSHDRQREKEQAAAASAAPVPEPVAPAPEPAPVQEAEIPVEDLPPLEYSELQAASSRRRRRRRAGSASTAVNVNANASGSLPARNVAPEAPTPPPIAPAPALALPKSAPVPPAYNIVSGYTVSQMNQGNDSTGPFMGPEPSPARGSTFSTAPSLRHVRNEALRSTPGHTVKHGESSLLSPAAVNHLANTVAQAIQIQTDRMVAELRRSNQVPTNVSVSLPPFPSTERVGVFVDVANLLYSARTLRMTVDFGKLLDFLRGNRRLVRAQAYCPTSPQPGDDQMFLQAVKGLGYRITTKNYKTFSSGAKKADLDLDLCMDVVRLVDGRAVDCIVLVSGDSDFMPMLDYCSDHGVRVEVAAFDESMSATLRQSCDLFVNLSMLEEIRA